MFSKIKNKVKNPVRNFRYKLAKYWVEKGESCLKAGDHNKAAAFGERACFICPRYDEAFRLQIEALLPGEDYRKVISLFHDWLKPNSYTEIGVFKGETLALASSETKIIGIDPKPRISSIAKLNAKIYSITSDEFFEHYNLLEELGESRLALAFIDGLHLFEQALKDFINLERYADENTVILVHDCLPVNQTISSRKRRSGYWAGDVWKLIPCLKKYRPDLSIHTIATPPSGLGLIMNLNPNSSVLHSKFDQIVSEYQNLSYKYLLKSGKNELLNIIPNKWELISQMLPPDFSQRSQ